MGTSPGGADGNGREIHLCWFWLESLILLEPSQGREAGRPRGCTKKKMELRTASELKVIRSGDERNETEEKEEPEIMVGFKQRRSGKQGALRRNSR